MRAATLEEITTTARRLLVEQGPDAASLRAIAREMGMTAPGLYRYYSSREELLRHVVASMFRELAGDIRGAIEAAGPHPASGFAIVGIAARVHKSGGKVDWARIGVTGLSNKGYRAASVESAIPTGTPEAGRRVSRPARELMARRLGA